MSIPSFGSGRINNPDHRIIKEHASTDMDRAAQADLNRYGRVMLNGRRVQDLTGHVRPTRAEMAKEMTALSGEGMALAKPVARYMEQGVLRDAGNQVLKKVAPGNDNVAVLEPPAISAVYDVKVKGDRVTIVEERVFQVVDNENDSKGFFKAKVTISGKKSDFINGNTTALKHTITHTKLVGSGEEAMSSSYPWGAGFSPMKERSSPPPLSGGHITHGDLPGLLDQCMTTPAVRTEKVQRAGGAEVEFPLTDQSNKDLPRNVDFKIHGRAIITKNSDAEILKRKRELMLGGLMSAADNDEKYAHELSRLTEQTFLNENIMQLAVEEKTAEKGISLKGTETRNVGYDFEIDEENSPSHFVATSESVYRADNFEDPELPPKGFIKAKMEVRGSREDLMEIRRLSEPLRGIKEFERLETDLTAIEKGGEVVGEEKRQKLEKMKARLDELSPHVDEWRKKAEDTKKQLHQAYKKLDVTMSYTPMVATEAEALDASYPGGY